MLCEKFSGGAAYMFKVDIYPFQYFSMEHLIAITMLILFMIMLYVASRTWTFQSNSLKIYEKIFACSLLLIELSKYVWEWTNNLWTMAHSLPLELCTISLYATILLLWTNDKRLYPFVLFAGIGGATQAILTPDLDYGFPHFRFFHFFYLHSAIILTALYFTWIKGMRPVFKNVIQTFIVLNTIALCIFLFNQKWQANYMFLLEKPIAGSLLDFLGPYPYYILSLEGIAFSSFLIIWLTFRGKEYSAN